MLLGYINSENVAVVGDDSAILIKNISIVSKKIWKEDRLLTCLHILTLQFLLIIFPGWAVNKSSERKNRQVQWAFAV